MRKKKLLNIVLRCSFALILFLLPMLRNTSLGWTNTMEGYFLLNFAGPSPMDPDIITLILQLVPNIMVLYLFSGIMLEDCTISYVYVFTRMGKKSGWLRQKALQLFAQILTVFVCLFVISFMIGTWAGFRIGEGGLGIYVRLLLFQCAPLFLLSFIQNFFALPYGRTQSFLLLLIFYVMSIGLALLLYNMNPAANFIFTLLPPNSQMYSWHSDSPMPQGMEGVFAPPIAGFTLMRTVIVLCTCFIIIYAIISAILEKRDLLELMKGESQ